MNITIHKWCVLWISTIKPGYVGIGTTAPGAKLDVKGPILYQGVKNTDGAVSTYKITTKRYHISSRFGASGGITVPLDMDIVNELCGDEDGCRVRAIMRRWNSDTETEGASWAGNGYILTYVAADGHWRITDTVGVDGNGTT